MSYTNKPQENYCICNGCGKKELVSSEGKLPYRWANFSIGHIADPEGDSIFSVMTKYDLQFCIECKEPLISGVFSSMAKLSRGEDPLPKAKSKAKAFDTGVTPPELERLTMLAEEASEVIKCVCKIIRHGWNSYDPDRPDTSNKQDLRHELEDVFAIANYMSHGRVDNLRIQHYIRGRWQQKLPYTHFQEGSSEDE